jgi:hypothetical protein
MRGTVYLSDGRTVVVYPDGKKLYAAYHDQTGSTRHDCESVTAERGKPMELVLVTGLKLVVGHRKATVWSPAYSPTVDRIVCGTDEGGHVADGIWFTTGWERHVDPANAS